MIALPLLVYFAVMWVAGFVIGKADRLPLRADREHRLHRRLQRLRARDRRRRRCLRRRIRRGARRSRRAADRGARPRRARLRRPLGAEILAQRRPPRPGGLPGEPAPRLAARIAQAWEDARKLLVKGGRGMDSSSLGLRLAAEALGTFLFFFLGFNAIAVSVDIGGGAISSLGIAFGVRTGPRPCDHGARTHLRRTFQPRRVPRAGRGAEVPPEGGRPLLGRAARRRVRGRSRRGGGVLRTAVDSLDTAPEPASRAAAHSCSN